MLSMTKCRMNNGAAMSLPISKVKFIARTIDVDWPDGRTWAWRDGEAIRLRAGGRQGHGTAREPRPRLRGP